MIVWGGTNGGGFEINTGGRYNPGTDSWTATSTTNAPEGRVYHTAVWTGSEMIVWGGTDFINYFNALKYVSKTYQQGYQLRHSGMRLQTQDYGK